MAVNGSPNVDERNTRAPFGRRGLIIALAAVVVIALVAIIVAVTRTSGGDSPQAVPKPSGAAPSGAPADPARKNQPGCAAKPSACGYPDATNTGVPPGTALQVMTGDQKITEAGTVIEGKDIRGCVTVVAPNVTIRNSKITCKGYYGIGSFAEQYEGGGLVVENVTVSCVNTSNTGIASYGMTVIRADVSGCENGFDVDKDMTVRDSYVHDPFSTAENHADGAQLTSGHGNIVMTHNTIYMPRSTSAIISAIKGNSNVLISDNLMSGGAYTLYCPRDSSTDFRVLDNRFSTIAGAKGGAYGVWTYCNKVAQNRGNVWDETLKPVTEE